jgi:hypothetical protein
MKLMQLMRRRLHRGLRLGGARTGLMLMRLLVLMLVLVLILQAMRVGQSTRTRT